MQKAIDRQLKDTIENATGVVYIDGKGDSNMLKDILEQAKKDGKHGEVFILDTPVSNNNANELLPKTRGLGMNIVCSLSDLEDCSPIQQEAILANCSTKIFLKNEEKDT